MHILRRFTSNSTKNQQKPYPQWKTPNPEIRRNPRTSCITKKVVNQFVTQINWLVSIRDELLSNYILKKTELRFAVSEQALADKRSINKWQVTCSMYNLFDRLNFYKVCADGFWITKFNFCFKFVNRTISFVNSWNAAPVIYQKS